MKIFNVQNFLNFTKGAIMGVAEVIPGVSGSTFALIMGIYDDFINLLHSISNFAKSLLLFVLRKHDFGKVKESLFEIDFRFGVPLIFGTLFSIILLAHAIEYVLENYPNYLFGFFFGLVLFSIYIPYKEMKNRRLIHIVYFLFSAVITFVILGFGGANNSNPSYLLLFVGGIVGISGLILPGVSGSFILLMLGLYEYVISLVKSLTKFDISTNEILSLASFGAGLFIGFVGFVRVIKYGFSKFPNEILIILSGIMLGSLRVLYPFYETVEGSDIKNLLMPWDASDTYDVVFIVLAIVAGANLIILMQFTKFDRPQSSHI